MLDSENCIDDMRRGAFSLVFLVAYWGTPFFRSPTHRCATRGRGGRKRRKGSATPHQLVWDGIYEGLGNTIVIEGNGGFLGTGWRF
jgi:hypothetical protein